MYYLHASNLFNTLVDHISSNRPTGSMYFSWRNVYNEECFIINEVFMYYLHQDFS